MKARLASTVFEGEDGGHEPRNVESLQKVERVRKKTMFYSFKKELPTDSF